MVGSHNHINLRIIVFSNLFYRLSNRAEMFTNGNGTQHALAVRHLYSGTV